MKKGEAVESAFHRLLVEHPLLIDVYGTCESKPRFVYPDGATSPVGKKYLEPDFLVVYPGQAYKLVEIERPSKSVATVQGQPRAEVNQSTFQVAEWKHYIQSHYEELRSRYPNIQARCKTAIIMSRTTQQAFGGIQDVRAYVGLIEGQYKIDEFLTYDDLLERALTAYALLTGLSPTQVPGDASAKIAAG